MQVLKASLLPGEETISSPHSSLSSMQTDSNLTSPIPSKFVVHVERKPEVEEQRQFSPSPLRSLYLSCFNQTAK
jgi:hypothetical protein